MASTTLLDQEFLHRIESLTLMSRKIFRGKMKGERRSRRRGSSSEFADYRNYVEGDDLRFIDWNIYARLDRLFLKLFLEEEDLHVHLLLDTSSSMGFGEPQKFTYAQRLAAAIAYIGLVNLDRIQIHAFGSNLTKATNALRGRRVARQLFDFLEELTPDGTTSINASAKAFISKARTGKGITILISDFLDPEGYEDALNQLAGNHMDVYVIHLLSPQEIKPDIQGDLRLVDAETGAYQEVTVSRPLLRQYDDTVRRFCGGIKEHCAKRGIAYVFSATDVPFDQLILKVLRKGGLVR